MSPVLALFLFSAAHAAEPEQDSEQATVEVTDEGVKVTAPGVSLTIDEDGVHLSAPGTTIEVGEDGVIIEAPDGTVRVGEAGVSSVTHSVRSSSGKTVQGSGKLVEETRPVASFHRIDVRGSADVVWTPSPQPGLQVRAEDNLLEHLSTRVDAGTLVIEFTASVSTRKPVEVTLSSSVLDSLSLAGSGDIEAHDLQGKNLRIVLAGSGDIDVDGTVDDLDVELRGSGDIDAAELVAQDVSVDLRGSGDVSVHAHQSALVDLRGSGDVEVAGKGTLRQDVRGSGDVSRR
jgi:hypothetical protein